MSTVKLLFCLKIMDKYKFTTAKVVSKDSELRHGMRLKIY